MSLQFIKHITITLFMTLVFLPIFAQQERPELITDRPDATEAPSVVVRGALQIESGALFTSFEDDVLQTNTTTYNTTLLRFGVLENLELRLGWDFVEQRNKLSTAQEEVTQSGLSPLLLGMKVNITQEKGWLPTIGLIGHLFLPFTASDDFKPQNTSVDFRFAFDHTLSDSSSIAYNLGAQWEADTPGATYIYTLAYGYSLTDSFGLYVELYGDMPENNSANHYWDAGLTYLLLPNLQLDATVGTSITEGQDVLVSAGFSYRIFK
ncbi:MAG: transporter [Patiriisocius sp.]